MTDRELLELAAKAAGIGVTKVKIENVTEPGDERFIGYMADSAQWRRGWFSPLSDDGDALRLAVKCNLNVCVGYASASACLQDDGSFLSTEEIKGDQYASTRRAIVRAAAEIGRAMK